MIKRRVLKYISLQGYKNGEIFLFHIENSVPNSQADNMNSGREKKTVAIKLLAKNQLK